MTRHANNRKRLNMSAYTVSFIDRRNGPGQEPQTETNVFIEKDLSVLDSMGVNRVEYITAQYEKEGYKVLEVQRLPKRETWVNLADLYEAANNSALAAQLAAATEQLQALQGVEL